MLKASSAMFQMIDSSSKDTERFLNVSICCFSPFPEQSETSEDALRNCGGLFLTRFQLLLDQAIDFKEKSAD